MEFARSYCWLVFPIMWFVFGLSRRLLDLHRQQTVAELLKAYAAHGKAPPPDVVRMMTNVKSA